MFADNKNIFAISVIILALVVVVGCIGTVGGKATIYKEPVTDSDIQVNIYKPDKTWQGTTLLADNHRQERSRIIEVDMKGQIVWKYELPRHLKEYTNPGFDVEWLPDNNILFVLPRKGIYEINRAGDVVWSYLDNKVSHDADRLPNGNTLVVFGGGDGMSDPQVREINPEGKIVWAWYAKDHFNRAPFKDIYNEGWTHTNAVSRLPNGNTLISPRNFNLLVEIDPEGSVVRTIGEGIFHHQHDPEMLPNGHILVANHRRPHRAIEIDPKTDEVVWRSPWFERDAAPVRDADRLPNGNALITASTKIVEITIEGEIVWQLELKGVKFRNRKDRPRLGFYKAERIASH
tara:strand:+ start:189 stop:1226 length:1038 start_codon:yes stop_codon:yes gene_type:complete